MSEPTDRSGDRTPGQSITSRLFDRGRPERSRTAMRVGPRASFFHRLGVPDPFSTAPATGPAAIERARRLDPVPGADFTWLSAAELDAEVAAAEPAPRTGRPQPRRRTSPAPTRGAARSRLVARLVGERTGRRTGERIVAGPVAADPLATAADAIGAADTPDLGATSGALARRRFGAAPSPVAKAPAFGSQAGSRRSAPEQVLAEASSAQAEPTAGATETAAPRAAAPRAEPRRRVQGNEARRASSASRRESADAARADGSRPTDATARQADAARPEGSQGAEAQLAASQRAASQRAASQRAPSQGAASQRAPSTGARAAAPSLPRPPAARAMSRALARDAGTRDADARLADAGAVDASRRGLHGVVRALSQVRTSARTDAARIVAALERDPTAENLTRARSLLRGLTGTDATAARGAAPLAGRGTDRSGSGRTLRPLLGDAPFLLALEGAPREDATDAEAPGQRAVGRRAAGSARSATRPAPTSTPNPRAAPTAGPARDGAEGQTPALQRRSGPKTPTLQGRPGRAATERATVRAADRLPGERASGERTPGSAAPRDPADREATGASQRAPVFDAVFVGAADASSEDLPPTARLRPTARVARAVAGDVARPAERGTAERATAALAARLRAGEADPDTRTPLAGAATGWLRAGPGAPERGAVGSAPEAVLVREPVHEPEPNEATDPSGPSRAGTPGRAEPAAPRPRGAGARRGSRAAPDRPVRGAPTARAASRLTTGEAAVRLAPSPVAGGARDLARPAARASGEAPDGADRRGARATPAFDLVARPAASPEAEAPYRALGGVGSAVRRGRGTPDAQPAQGAAVGVATQGARGSAPGSRARALALAPAAPTVPPSVRAAQRSAAADPASRIGSRVSLAASPVAQVLAGADRAERGFAEPGFAERGVAAAPRRARARRDEVVVRTDASGRAILSPAVSRDLAERISDGARVTTTHRRVSPTARAAGRTATEASSRSLLPRPVPGLDWSALLPGLIGLADADRTQSSDAPDASARPRAAAQRPSRAVRGGERGATAVDGRSGSRPAQVLVRGDGGEVAPSGAPPRRARAATVVAAERTDLPTVRSQTAQRALGVHAGTLGRLGSGATSSGAGPRGVGPLDGTGVARSRAGAAEPTWLDADPSADPAAPTGARAARRVGPRLEAAEPTTGRRVRSAGGLLSALARAEDPQDVVRMVLERSDQLASASRELPGEAQSLIQRILRSTAPEEPGRGRVPAEARTLTQFRTVTRRVMTPAPAGRGLRGPSERASATSVDGGGASNVTKLAGKLMKLIHLAESERRVADAQRQVRMAEDSADARGESGAGRSGGESAEDITLNIKALRQDVLDAVLRELENISSRREDPDGPSIWS